MNSNNGFEYKPISEYLNLLKKFIPHNFSIHCEMTYTDCPKPYNIYWKVKNVGPVAEFKNDIRGQIEDRGRKITENSNFYGQHYIECYIVKDGVCVARRKVKVPIGRR